MNLASKLSQRIGIHDIQEVVLITANNNDYKQELYDLIYSADDLVGYQALWVFTHFSREDNQWLFDKQEELIDEVLICRHPGKRRLLLNLLLKQPLSTPPRTDFLDFCLDRMISKDELPGVQSLCLKLAYLLCLPIPELLQEYRTMLEIMEPNMLQISLRTARKNILIALNKKNMRL
ncbi:hypothetical protein LJC44_06370 [Parabacteroides sp. OttesenSCG-928-G06]|nr:hypothetical protein [Parabacteroides sp. OttesenSCG-928-K15]MDL2282709.1 hypothetical protein [Parabacteroides sp. OttesenSCG-928-G06]